MDSVAFIRKAAQEKKDCIETINKTVWKYAELGYEERRSSGAIAEALRAEGFEVEVGVGGLPTSIRASYGSGRPVIGILGEYDALPNLSQEAGVAEHRPIPGAGCGHGCGHSALGAGTAGAAILVKEWLNATRKKGTVLFWGCPAEETGFGKAFLAKAGCFQGMDAAFSWHPGGVNAVEAVRTIAYYKVRFDFHGRSAHAGACPEAGRSALDACELMNVGVNYLREHVPGSVRIHYAYLDCGGSSPNVVQENASLSYFIRAPKLAQCSEILTRVRKIAEGAALMTETRVKISVLGGLNDYVPNAVLTELLSHSFEEEGAPDFDENDFEIARRFLAALPQEQRKNVIEKGAVLNGVSSGEFALHPLHTRILPFTPDSMGHWLTSSSDVGDVSYQVPTAQLGAAIGIPGTVSHTWQFTAQVGSPIGNKASIAAARAIALACVRIYEDPSILEEAKAQWKEETHGEYLSPIPDEISYRDVL